MAATKSAATKSAKTKSSKARKPLKAAARTAVVKKSAPRKKAAVSTSRAKAKPNKPRASAARVTKSARPKQRFVVSHHREEDFKADGLRAYAQYRDLGIAKGTHGLHFKGRFAETPSEVLEGLKALGYMGGNNR